MTQTTNDTTTTTTSGEPPSTEPTTDPTASGTTGPTEPAEPTEDGATDGDPTDPDDDRSAGNKEAARRRRQLRQVEAERDGLRDQLDDARRQIVDQVLERERARLQVTPAAFFAHVDDVETLLDEHGAVSLAAVRTAAKEAREKFGAAPTNRGDLFDRLREHDGKRSARAGGGTAADVFENVRR